MNFIVETQGLLQADYDGREHGGSGENNGGAQKVIFNSFTKYTPKRNIVLIRLFFCFFFSKLPQI